MSCDLAIFDIKRLGEMALAATLVIVGIGLKRSTDQIFDKSNSSGLKNTMSLVGIGLYISGLALVGINLNHLMPEYRHVFWPALSGIALSELVADFTEVPKLLVDLVYAGSWLALGFVVSSHLNKEYRYVGFLASALALFANFFALPYQRSHGIVDGIGLPLYLLAWSVIAVIVAIPGAKDIEVKGMECLPLIKQAVPQAAGLIDDFQCAVDSGCLKGVTKFDATALGKLAFCMSSKGCFK